MVDLGVCGFKCFMIESGVDEFPMVTEADIRRGLQQLQVSKTDSISIAL
jgi:allantoinase